jgi:5'(3')-deoxyribonucleotidase
MDGVIADFEASCLVLSVQPQEGKLIPGIYRSLPLIHGAKEGIQQLQDWGFFVMCLTKIPSKNPGAASEKIHWLNEHFPNLNDHIVITPDKGCIGLPRDFLIDDHPEWANADSFKGQIIPFNTYENSPISNWSDVLWYFETYVLKVMQGQTLLSGLY